MKIPQKAKLPAVILGALAVFTATGAASCDSFTQPFQDAPRTGQINNDPAEIITMPDGFNNVATKCDGHGHRIYTSYHGSYKYGFGFAVPEKDCGPQ